MIWTIIGIVVAIILGATALFFHQKKRKHSWIPAVLAIIALIGSGLHVRHEIINHNSHPQAVKQVNHKKPQMHKQPANKQQKSKNAQQKQNNKKHINQPQQKKQNQKKPVNNKWAKLKHKIIVGAVVCIFMLLLTGAIVDS